jgi:hypothetical protein
VVTWQRERGVSSSPKEKCGGDEPISLSREAIEKRRAPDFFHEADNCGTVISKFVDQRLEHAQI